MGRGVPQVRECFLYLSNSKEDKVGASKHGESDGRGGWIGGQTLDFNMGERHGKGSPRLLWGNEL